MKISIPLFCSVFCGRSMFEVLSNHLPGTWNMQIMPATGQEISGGMGWPPDYKEDDLNRPMVSIRLGARYLARQRDYFGAIWWLLWRLIMPVQEILKSGFRWPIRIRIYSWKSSAMKKRAAI